MENTLTPVNSQFTDWLRHIKAMRLEVENTLLAAGDKAHLETRSTKSELNARLAKAAEDEAFFTCKEFRALLK